MVFLFLYIALSLSFYAQQGFLVNVTIVDALWFAVYDRKAGDVYVCGTASGLFHVIRRDRTGKLF